MGFYDTRYIPELNNSTSIVIGKGTHSCFTVDTYALWNQSLYHFGVALFHRRQELSLLLWHLARRNSVFYPIHRQINTKYFFFYSVLFLRYTWSNGFYQTCCKLVKISLSIASTVVVFDKIKKINIFLIEYVINVLPFDRFFYSLIAV